MPDHHRGDTALGKSSIPEWVSLKDWDNCLKYDFECMIKYLSDRGITRISCIGFCWGAWAWAKACSEGFDFKCCIGEAGSARSYADE